MLPVLLLGRDPLLRKKSEPIPHGTDLHELADQMRTSMQTSDGIGIAAPQIGKSLRMFIVATDLFQEDVQASLSGDTFINPTLKLRGFKREMMEEGCLSIPKVFGEVSRPLRATLRAFDLEWNEIRINADGLLARVFQHEVDHLNGTLFVDLAEKQTLHKLNEDETLRAWSVEEMEVQI